ncbi:unnamed protein product [Lasius platythorax]|uniref:Uncharacterized protein n=1 Tax=Lasius platythorax TaxID=488582 RepID=A0AAV2NMV7_9HYME
MSHAACDPSDNSGKEVEALLLSDPEAILGDSSSKLPQENMPGEENEQSSPLPGVMGGEHEADMDHSTCMASPLPCRLVLLAGACFLHLSNGFGFFRTSRLGSQRGLLGSRVPACLLGGGGLTPFTP